MNVAMRLLHSVRNGKRIGLETVGGSNQNEAISAHVHVVKKSLGNGVNIIHVPVLQCRLLESLKARLMAALSHDHGGTKPKVRSIIELKKFSQKRSGFWVDILDRLIHFQLQEGCDCDGGCTSSQ